MTRAEYYQKNKEIIDAKNKKWREDNPEKAARARKVYYLEHKQEAIATAKRWKERNPLKNKEINRVYRKLNRKQILLKNHEYAKRKKDFLKISQKKYYEKNKEKIRLKAKEYRHLHPEKARNYMKFKRDTDVNFKLRQILRHRLFCALKGKEKNGSAIKLLGCTIPELKIYLESKFQPGMTWANWSQSGWHIDHIIPLSSFDLTNMEQFLRACNYTNLQPLWGGENIRKSNKLDYVRK
jgi:hypothetical protein